MISVDTFIKYETINNKMEYFCDMDSGYNESDRMDRQLLHIQKAPNGNSGVVKAYIAERKRFNDGHPILSYHCKPRIKPQLINSIMSGTLNARERLNREAKEIVSNIKPPWRPSPTAQAIYEAHIEENYQLGLTKRYRLIDDIMWGIFDWQESLKEKNK